MPPTDKLKVIKTSMMLAILVEKENATLAFWKEAVRVAKEYLAATEGKFGGLKWEYDDWTRRGDSHIVVFFKQKE